MIMRINTQNTKMPWDPYLTPINSPTNIFPSVWNNQGTDQELPCQYSNGEDFPAFDAPSQPVIESQQAIFGPHELPDLPQLPVQPLMSPADLTHHSKVAGYDSPTSHLFASPIWPPDENVYTGSPEFLNAANEVNIASGWGLMDGFESFDESFSQIREICGTSKEMPILQHARTRSLRRRKEKPNIEPSVAFGRNMNRCGFRGCGRVYQRIEHLKRHVNIDHTEYPVTFSCEFCGKSDFRRVDNLRIHRKLHARQPSRHARVQFVPEAAVILEEEMRSKEAR
ncbi:C2H2 type master regulator of conidiophore development brlA [Fusarium oxysporum f. sp. raphani]|uniref:C2H2 type master regulator of conidiophore development brlA n=1 Tax=Fusarium oxysporum f. sp. raphani TaxID=96318 RepID=A0A8J5NFS6_FUSOX|nr:C2H2 type master regulator of conidiophore development brlA [Fusarium oxysporum f. sp. raphani]